MTGVIDVGGGTRGVYGAGVFDYCLEEGISFDYLIGVSAGSANEASFLAGQKGRNYRFYSDYCFRSEYMGMKALRKTGNYLNLEYIYGDGLTNRCGEDPLDYPALKASGKTFVVVCTDADTGRAVYFDSADMRQDDYGAIKGSSCVPVASKPYAWKDRLLFDGGISDPIPYEKALQDGCDRLVVILTRPRTYHRSPKKDEKLARILKRKYPLAARALAERAGTYNRQLEEVLQLEKEGAALVLSPYSIQGMETLSRDKEKIKWLYDLGREDAARMKGFVQ